MGNASYIIITLSVAVLLTILELGVFIAIMSWHHIRSERERRASDERMSSFLRHMRIESGLSRKDTRRILDEIQQTNRDNALFLRMIFERVDKPPLDNSGGSA